MKEWTTGQAKEMEKVTDYLNKMDEVVGQMQLQMKGFQNEVTESQQDLVNNAQKINTEMKDLWTQKNINIEEVIQLKVDMEDAFKDQYEIINKQNESVEETRHITNQLVEERNQHQDEVANIELEVEELRLWKEEITSQQGDRPKEFTEIKSEEPEDIENNYEIEDIEPEIEDTEIEVEQPEDDNNHNMEIKEKNICHSSSAK